MSINQKKHTWKTEGFSDFVRGSFGNGGQNSYVSRAGILQRIHQFDFTGNGFVDLVFCNSQSHYEKPDAQVLSDPLGEPRYRGLRSHGCRAAAVADLNGDGYDDLILGSFKDGLATDLNAMVYYGSPGGLTGGGTQPSRQDGLPTRRLGVELTEVAYIGALRRGAFDDRARTTTIGSSPVGDFTSCRRGDWQCCDDVSLLRH